ncbi:hypothetical protein OG407_49725 [Streptomyces sp. NBC_01515]|uniref:hypothetical protein n=1 Tax=Streptomyces sp. NBC_01515 TaxID=2903890 RepID=UPI0038676239
MSAAGRETPRWLAPAPLWTAGTVGTASEEFLRPWIAELRTDSFLADFLSVLGGADGRSPADLPGTLPERSAEDGSYRLFTSRSRRYYLVVATLACRRPGIPDHAVQPALGERVLFVLRRIGQGAEKGFVPSATDPGTWQAATADALVPGERELPLHRAPVAAFAAPGTAAATLGMAAGQPSARTVFYGYIPVSGGDTVADDVTTTYVIRAVLVRDPCGPVISAPTHPFELAGPRDRDAPVRPSAALTKGPAS